MNDEQATGTPQQNLPQEENRPDDQQESPEGGGDSPEGKAEQDQERDTGGTAGGTPEAEGDDGTKDARADDDDEVAKARKAAEEEEEAKKKVKDLEEDPPEKLEDWPDDKAKYETFGGAEGEESYDESVTSKLGPSSLRYREDGSVEIEGEEVDDPDEFKGEPIPGGPTDPAMSDSRAYGEPDLTDETSVDADEARSGDDSEGDDSQDGDSESSGEGGSESSGEGDSESSGEGDEQAAGSRESDG